MAPHIEYTQHEETTRGYTAYNAILKGYSDSEGRHSLVLDAQDTLQETLKRFARVDHEALQRAKDEARAYTRKREESHERCDTDGFVTQYFDGISSSERQRQAQIELQGGQDVFCALFDLEGRRVNAELRTGQYGDYWLLKGADRPKDGTKPFVTAFPARAATLRRKGYQEGYSTYPAKAATASEGYGLSGRCWVISEMI